MYQDPNQQYGGYPPQGGGHPPQGNANPQQEQGYAPQGGGYPTQANPFSQQAPGYKPDYEPGYQAGSAGPDQFQMQQWPQEQDPYAAEQAYYQQQMIHANLDEQQRIQEKMEKLERKQAEKKAKDAERAKEGNMSLERKLARDHEDNQGCANMLCMWGIVNALMWAGPLMGDDWYTKIMYGMGVHKLQITTGLFNMDTAVLCTEGYIKEDRICTSLEPYSGHFALEQMKELMCKEVRDGCEVMSSMLMFAHVPLVACPVAAALETLSVLILYFYWHAVASPLLKRVATQTAFLAPAVGGFGFVIWMCFSPNMQVLPRMWCAAQGSGDFANNVLFGLQETWTIPFGWCSWMVLLVWICSSIRAFSAYSCLGQHQDELRAYQKKLDAELKQESKELVAKDMEEAGYGSTS